MDLITSRSNPRIKRARALRQRKQRENDRAFLVEGIHHVGAAFEAGAEVEEVYFAPEMLEGTFAENLIEKIISEGVACYPVTVEVFNSLADKEHPQGILAVVRQPGRDLQGLNPENFPWGIALVAPQDPGNVGAILRTVDAVGSDGMLLLEGGVDPYHPTAVRASMGAIFRKPVVTAAFTAFARWVEKHGYHVYGTSAHAGLDYRDVPEYQRPLILLFGSEREGLTAEHAAVCEKVIALPMYGRATSLNLAVAAGVMLYSVVEKSDRDRHSIWK